MLLFNLIDIVMPSRMHGNPSRVLVGIACALYPGRRNDYGRRLNSPRPVFSDHCDVALGDEIQVFIFMNLTDKGDPFRDKDFPRIYAAREMMEGFHGDLSVGHLMHDGFECANLASKGFGRPNELIRRKRQIHIMF